MTNTSSTTTPSGTTKPIIFFGTEEFSATSLQALIDARFTIAAVVTKPDTKRGRGKTLTPPAVKRIAQKYDIPVWQPTSLRDIVSDITALQPVTGVLVSFGKIIPQSIIDLFSPGIINVHPSRLPQYRGPSPIETAILNGDTETGVSIMQLSAAMDAGPVYGFTAHNLNGTETTPELYDTLGDIGAAMLTSLLPGILDGTVAAQPQDDQNATYCPMITKADSTLNWTKSAAQLEREIRAYIPWPGSKTTLFGIDVTVTKAHVSPTKSGGLSIQCGDKNYLVIDTLKPSGKKEMPAQAFLSGYVR